MPLIDENWWVAGEHRFGVGPVELADRAIEQVLGAPLGNLDPWATSERRHLNCSESLNPRAVLARRRPITVTTMKGRTP